MDHVEARMAEDELEIDDFAEFVLIDGVEEKEVKETANKMYNLLLTLTTAEANAMVRRCQGRNDILAWRNLCASRNPRTLASGVKAVS